MQPELALNPQYSVNNLNYLNTSFKTIDKVWQDFLLTNCYDELLSIDEKLTKLSQHETIYPPQELIFNALRLTPLRNIEVVILGQDPYHGEGEANGLAFSVNSGIKVPPSLRNIYKELSLEYSKQVNYDGTRLVEWAHQGVLLLNTTLTVLKDRANSLANIGWQQITDKIITHISNTQTGVVFILWGNNAKQKIPMIDTTKHHILSSVHPSPLSVQRGFFGCNHFIKTNEYLISIGKSPIEWI